ncbi:hypothetical protein [Photorhabdus hainanensis]|uniref:hypothetical protein n=1 Tax=Photorhabdus hainanensis TaxID=1004166 RepID=UPI001FE49392|nr:hypothetical protein [Photorhabdus hainanensis]
MDYRKLGLVKTVNLAKNVVSNSRKINGKALTGDVNLNAGDVKVQPMGNYALSRQSYTKGKNDSQYVQKKSELLH